MSKRYTDDGLVGEWTRAALDSSTDDEYVDQLHRLFTARPLFRKLEREMVLVIDDLIAGGAPADRIDEAQLWLSRLREVGAMPEP